MAVITFNGPYENISAAYEELFKWIEENGCMVDGPSHEVYIVSPGTDKIVEPESYVMEIQFPVKKKE